MSVLRVFIALLISFATALPTFAQQQPTVPPPVNPNPSTGQNILTFFSGRTPYEFWLTCVIGLIGIVIIAFLILSVRKTQNPRPEDFSRPIVVVTVVIGTLILITAGYSNEQIAPAFGLFGTIIGYILGRFGPGQAGPGHADSAGPSQNAPDQTRTGG